MKSSAKKYVFRLLVYLVIGFANIPIVVTQKVLNFGPEEPTASIHYNEFLYATYKNAYNKLPDYPVNGVYSPTHYADGSVGMRTGAGACNYVFVPTNGVLLPGRQYHLSLTVKVGKAYAQSPYFQSHFGVALASDLFKNHFGLWSKHFIPLGIKSTEELVTINYVFRPLCTSEYLVLGVFQGPAMDQQDGFAFQYGFELHNLVVEQFDDPQAQFVYMCDAFEEERLKKTYTTGYDTDTIYFNSGSAEILENYLPILDSLPSRLRTKHDLVSLYAYTDKAGSENNSLGAARNTAVREALIGRGIDTSRILMANYGESRASDQISFEDRRVEIEINRGKLYQKYYTEAMQSAIRGEYNMAQAKMTRWIKMVPPENAIYALFDCWGEGDKATIFRHDLVKSIKSRSYNEGNDLKFTFDSLYCEDQKGRTLSTYLKVNYLPDSIGNCFYSRDSLGDANQLRTIDRIYAAYKFPRVDEVGERGNKALPYMIIHVSDTSFQNRYLPLMLKACEEQLINWENYAMLYDKINVVRNGHQRYGTQWKMDENGMLSGLVPFEDDSMVAEFRKQVGLSPLSDF